MDTVQHFTERIAENGRTQVTDPGALRIADGFRYAGTHLLVDCWGAKALDDVTAMELAFRDAVEASGATLLGLRFHRFAPGGGFSGVALLAESHISIHTWPEHGFAAADVFMCGDAWPYRAVRVLMDAMTPETVTVAEHRRGIHSPLITPERAQICFAHLSKRRQLYNVYTGRRLLTLGGGLRST